MRYASLEPALAVVPISSIRCRPLITMVARVLQVLRAAAGSRNTA
jgi:hypothetical protein